MGIIRSGFKVGGRMASGVTVHLHVYFPVHFTNTWMYLSTAKGEVVDEKTKEY